MGNEQELIPAGWEITGRHPEMHKVQKTDATGATIATEESTGNVVWVLSDGKGHYREMTVAVTGTGGSSANYRFSIVVPPKDLPEPAGSTSTRPPEPNVSTTARQIPVWNPQTSRYDWQTNPNYTPPSSTATRPPEPNVSTTAAQIPIWNQQTGQYDWRPNPNYKAPEPKGPDVRVVGNQLIDVATGRVVYQAPEGVKWETAQDGTILMIDPRNPTQPQVVWKPEKAPDLIPGQTATQGRFIQRDPATGALTTVDNPLGNAAQQKYQDLLDGINNIEQQLASGAMTIPEATQYKDLLRQNFDASLKGTTPWQIEQDNRVRQQARMQSGKDLLNQRVVSGSGLAESLLSQAVGIVGNKNFMDPSAVAGFSPFAGAADYVTGLGGGQGVYDAATQAVQAGLNSNDPAAALLSAAFNPGGQQAQQQPLPQDAGNGATDPGLALIKAALGQQQYRQPQQVNENGPLQRGALFG